MAGVAFPWPRRAWALCGASCLALKSSTFLVREKIISEILFRLKSFRRASAYLIVEICSQRSHKKCEKREKGQCYYPFPHSCFKVVPDSFNLSLGLRMKCSAEGQMSSHSFLKTFPEFWSEQAASKIGKRNKEIISPLDMFITTAAPLTALNSFILFCGPSWNRICRFS